MKKFIVVTLLTHTAFAAAPYKADCKLAGGFYGNVTITEKNDGIEVHAQQGFGYELAGDLGQSRAASVRMLFPKKNCHQTSANARLISCSARDLSVELLDPLDNVMSELKTEGVNVTLKESVEVDDLGIRRSFPVSIRIISSDNSERVARQADAMVDFGDPSKQGRMGACRF